MTLSFMCCYIKITYYPALNINVVKKTCFKPLRHWHRHQVSTPGEICVLPGSQPSRPGHQ